MKIICRDLNWRAIASEATTMPTLPQLLTSLFVIDTLTMDFVVCQLGEDKYFVDVIKCEQHSKVFTYSIYLQATKMRMVTVSITK